MTSHFSEIKISTDTVASTTKGLTATLRMIANSHTAERGSKWAVSCEWNGRTFGIQDRNSPVYALCRELLMAGCPDLPLEIRNPKGQLVLTIRSIHAGAKVVVRESSRTSIRLAPYEPHPGDSVSASEQGGQPSCASAINPEHGVGRVCGQVGGLYAGDARA
jgi:hypothetical protein